VSEHVGVRGLRAGYGSLAVVHGIDLDVAPGEVVALLGPNGAGKSTTLLTIAGFLPRLGGQILWNGVDRQLAPHKLARRGIALVAERAVFRQLTVAANLRLGRGDPARALALFPELEPLLRRPAGLLSGGEQQMLTMGRALAARPAVLLLDELSLGLAPVVVSRLLTTVRQAADDGAAVLMVEQQARRALAISERAYLMNHGRVTAAGDAGRMLGELDSGQTSYFAVSDTGQSDTGQSDTGQSDTGQPDEQVDAPPSR
jgi:branched-chain amino acid transport system ATP-binding protein